MNAHSLFGLIAYNLFLLASGTSVLFAIRGWHTWGELVRLSGVAYLLGVAATGVVYSIELVVDIPFSLVSIFVTGCALSAAGAAVGWGLGRTLPPIARSRSNLLPRLSWLGAFFAATTVVYLEALFRAGRLAALDEYDAWAFWVPKAKVIYILRHLDVWFFSSLPGPSYPPVVPALEAAAFHFMGGVDVVTLHLQFWFLFVGFIGAVIGVLGPRVPTLLLWPSLLLALLTPQITGRALQPQADLLLDELVALSAILVAVWLTERRDWQIAGASLLLAGAMLTKREAFLLTACILLPALAATVRKARQAWPRLALVAGFAVLCSLPWRIWFVAHGLPSDAPQAGAAGLFSHLDRFWPSLELTIRDMFGYHLWLVVVPLTIVAVIAALLAGKWTLPVFVAGVVVLGIGGFTWITWAIPSLPITENAALNPVTRAVGSLVLVSAGLVPLLLTAAWRGADPAEGETPE
jgi:hypothetical protein